LQRPNGGGTGRQKDVRREGKQLHRMFGIELNITGPADIDPHIAADLPTRFLQRLQKGREAPLSFQIIRGEID
jgi:hypothetical protein